MSALIQEVTAKYNGKASATDSVKFQVNGDNFCLTDGTLYAVTDEGQFLPGFKKVRNLAAVEKFINLRA